MAEFPDEGFGTIILKSWEWIHLLAHSQTDDLEPVENGFSRLERILSNDR